MWAAVIKYSRCIFRLCLCLMLCQFVENATVKLVLHKQPFNVSTKYVVYVVPWPTDEVRIPAFYDRVNWYGIVVCTTRSTYMLPRTI